MIERFAVLLACQLASETLARLLALPVPGTVPGIVVSLAPMSVTARVAMALAERARGIPTLAAALVICTGIVGAAIVTPLMNALGLKDFAARGLPQASRRMASARRGRVRSIHRPALSRASPSASTAASPRWPCR